MEKDLGPGSRSQLCVSLRISAVSALRTVLTQRPQRYAELNLTCFEVEIVTGHSRGCLAPALNSKFLEYGMHVVFNRRH
jgi:hypothetical protein